MIRVELPEVVAAGICVWGLLSLVWTILLSSELAKMREFLEKRFADDEDDDPADYWKRG